MSSKPTANNSTAKRRRDQRWAALQRQAYANSVCGVVVVGLPFIFGGVGLIVHGCRRIAQEATEAASYLRGALYIVAGAALLAGVIWLLATTVRRLSRQRPSDPFGDVLSTTAERPFVDRLADFLDEQPTPAVGGKATPGASRISFFLAFLPGRRRGPKSPSAIREILLRIHRLLGGNGSTS